jgi:hypothetical protein
VYSECPRLSLVHIHPRYRGTPPDNAVWVIKGATLSDKTAQKEFGLTQEEIIDAIKTGKLQYRHNTLYGNPCLKLLRNEVEALVNTKYGSDYELVASFQ